MTQVQKNSSNFSLLEKEYQIIINNIVNTFRFLSNGVIDSDDLKQEALIALYRASCKNSARPYIIKSIINAVWQAANKFKLTKINTEILGFNRNIDQVDTLLPLDLSGLPLRAQKIIQMMLCGSSKEEILRDLQIKSGTYNKLLARVRRKII